jgi:hypothetical protein
VCLKKAKAFSWLMVLNFPVSSLRAYPIYSIAIPISPYPPPPRVPYDGLNSTPNLMATKSVRSRTFKIRSPSVSRAPSIAAAIFPKVFV